MRIGELATKSGFPIKTLRYYDDIGLIRPRRRNPSSRFREYGEEALDMLALVRSAKLAGLNLSQIKKVLTASRRGAACDQVIPLLDAKVAEIDGAIRALQELRSRLVRVLKKGNSTRSKKRHECPILSGLVKNSRK